MGRSVLLLVNRRKPRVAAAIDRVRAIVEQHGSIVGEHDTRGPRIDDARGADLVLVLGGDGTLLAQARRTVDLGVPMVGVNLGTLGFLAEFDLPALERHAATLLGDGPLDLRERILIRAEGFRQNATDPHFSELALNDVVVTAGPPYRLIEIGLSIDNEDSATVRGDGVVVATPIGSTAYNVSAGGPIMSPNLDTVSIVPIAAHSLAFRPIIVGGESTIELEMRRINEVEGGGDDGTCGTTLVLDGQVIRPLFGGDRVVVSRHERRIKLVRNPESNFWRTLRRKMHWAVSPGAGPHDGG
jgi:NAD+ kinase